VWCNMSRVQFLSPGCTNPGLIVLGLCVQNIIPLKYTNKYFPWSYDQSSTVYSIQFIIHQWYQINMCHYVNISPPSAAKVSPSYLWPLFNRLIMYIYMSVYLHALKLYLTITPFFLGKSPVYLHLHKSPTFNLQLQGHSTVQTK